MDEFRCRSAVLPVYLYRVQYPRCQTVHSGEGLTAKDTNVIYSKDEIKSFCQSIEQQMTWGHRGAQPYITCFSDKDHAKNWARKEPWNPSVKDKGSWALLTIDTRLMPDTYIFSLKDLVTSLDIMIPERASQHENGAYLCLHRIPTSAIVDWVSP